MEVTTATPAEFAEIVPESWETYRDIIEATGFELPE